jgi:hypothetical protein
MHDMAVAIAALEKKSMAGGKNILVRCNSVHSVAILCVPKYKLPREYSCVARFLPNKI